MFTTASSLSDLNVPHFETRKALIVLNLQNDTFYEDDEIYICKKGDYIDGIRDLVPFFRNIGDIVWVQTEIAAPADASSRSLNSKEVQASKNALDVGQQEVLKQESQDTAERDNTGESNPQSSSTKMEESEDSHMDRPLSIVESLEMLASAQAMAEKRSTNTSVLIDNTILMEEKPAKLRASLPRLYLPATPGIELIDELKEVMDNERDMTVTKQYYSAFEQTSLLMSLRMRLVTELYICGCLTNIAVYATVADAVQHGFDVNIVEDCLGYRTAAKHEEAMRQMADVFGVDGIDSEELIGEAGGRAPPDTEEPMFSGPGPEGIGLGNSSLANEHYEVGALPHGLDQETAKNAQGSQFAQDIRSKTSRPTISQRTQADLDTEDDIPTIPTSEASAEIDSAREPSRISPPQNTKPSDPQASRSARTESPQVTDRRDGLGSGDSRVFHQVLTPTLSEEAFKLLREEVKWHVMHHRGGEVPRLVAVQGEVGIEGSVPVYRHPADESPPLLPYSPTVERIRNEIEGVIKQPLNHVLIQLYRDGVDNISEHSDKTLDIARGSNIINVSLGAQRVMTLRTKKAKKASGSAKAEEQRQTQRIPLPHNSAFILGPRTNAEWLHGVRADKRPVQQKDDKERAYQGERISLTFRHIGTLMSAGKKKIWGQGAKNKSKATAGDLKRVDATEMEAMIVAFGKENHQTDFDWDAEYGQGFDVVNLHDDTETR